MQVSERELLRAAEAAAKKVKQLDVQAAKAREDLGTALRALHEIAPVRVVAKETGMSATTVSNLWRGHVCATPENIIACIAVARKELT